MTKKIYDEDRDTDKYESTVMKHMLAMSAEDLYGKAAIAVELAYRDWQVEQLREALRGLVSRYVGLVLSGDAGNWDAETEQEVITARKVLEETK